MFEGIEDEIIEYGMGIVDEVEVACIRSESVSIELKKTVPAHAGESYGTGLVIRVIDGGRIGSSSTNSPGTWRSCLDQAIASARLAEAVPWGGLPGPVPLSGEPLSFDPSVRLDPDLALSYCNELLQGAEEYPDADVVGGGAGFSLSTVLLANSAGIRYHEEHSSVSASLEAIADQSTGFEYDRSAFMDIDPQAIGRTAAELATGSRNGLPIDTGTYDLLFSPMAFASLAASLLQSALNGRNVHMGRSFLAGKLGEVIASEDLTVTDDPFYQRGLGSTRFDAEGVPTSRMELIKDGILTSYLYDLKTAYRFGTKSTGNAAHGGPGGGVGIGVHNMVFDAERMAEPGEGTCIYIHDVIGAHTANPLTGDFSVEVQNSFFMEDGVKGDPIRKAMLAGNIFEMLGKIIGMGETPRRVGSVIVPPVRVSDMRLVG